MVCVYHVTETISDRLQGFDPISVGLRTFPIGFGIIGGALIALLLIPFTKGRITHIMIFFNAIMTGFTAAVSVAKPGYSGPVYAIVTLASLGVGGVIVSSLGPSRSELLR
jgi:hypothetical protein